MARSHPHNCLGDELRHAAQPLLQREQQTCLKTLCNHPIRKKDVAAGRQIRSFVLASALGSNRAMRMHLIRCFSNAGSLSEAAQEFHGLPQRDCALWTATIAALVRNGEGVRAIGVYHQMLKSNEKPSVSTHLAVLSACASTGASQEGRIIHRHLIERGFESDSMVGKYLFNMYVKCGLVEEAGRVLFKLPRQDVGSWNLIISGCVQHGRFEEAFRYFEKMLGQGVKPDRITYIRTLKACSGLRAVDQIKNIHRDLVRSGMALDVYLGSALIDAYAKCGLMDDARKAFFALPQRNVVVWTTLIAGLEINGFGLEALDMFEKMQGEGVKPNKVTFVCVVKACGSASALECGRLVHNQIVERGFESDLSVANTIIDMYAKCSSMVEARRVFCGLPKRDVVSWNALISGCVHHGQGEEALKLYEEMQQQGLKPSKVTYVCILKACSSITSLEQGSRYHEQLMKSGIELDLSLGNVLVDMYGKCGSVEQAYQVFLKLPKRDVVSWSSIIDAFSQTGQAQKALSLFEEMQQEGVRPNEISFACAFRACGSLMALERGMLIHNQLKESELELDLCLGNVLLDMYIKCGGLEEACDVFQNLSKRDVVSWSTMINGFVQRGLSHEAFQYFQKMQDENIRPDKVTYVSILKACANATALNHGKLIHSQLVESGLELDPFIANTLIDMYAKCGSMSMAHQVFLKLPVRDLVTWNAIIDGYSQQGYGRDALFLFERMLEDNMNPDKATFVSLLSACSHTGLVDEGLHVFKSMSEEYLITPTLKHYSCVVDMLGRAGKIVEAYDFISVMTVDPDAEVWMSLLGACRTYSNAEVGRLCFESIINIDPRNSSAYLLMSNIYAAVGRPKDECEIQMKLASWKRTNQRSLHIK